MDNYSDAFYQNNYSRKAAVKYALDYALKPNPHYRYFASHGDGGGDCSSFVSQCLYAGGAQMVYSGPWPWWYSLNSSSQITKHTWSLSWSVANSLYWFLKTRSKSSIKGLRGTEVKSLQELELGDIIQYENYSGAIYHSAIITAFAYNKGEKVPLISQHSFNAMNISYIKPKAKKMHLMKIVL